MSKTNSIMRPADIFGPGNPLPIGHTTFWKDYVYQPGGDEFVPGTNIPRLRLVPLGKRAVGAFADEVFELIEALRTLRDTSPLRPPSILREQGIKGGRASAAKRARH
jgi:hypothetical protein